MGLINRCRVCGLNYTPHGLDAVVRVIKRDAQHGRAEEVPLCEKCTRKLINWLNGLKMGVEDEQDGQQKAEGTSDSEP